MLTHAAEVGLSTVPGAIQGTAQARHQKTTWTSLKQVLLPVQSAPVVWLLPVRVPVCGLRDSFLCLLLTNTDRAHATLTGLLAPLLSPN